MEPVLLKSLRLLRDAQEPMIREHIIEQLGEHPLHVEKALEELVERNILAQTSDYYYYLETLDNEELLQRLQTVYERVEKKNQSDMIVAAILSTATDNGWTLRLNTLREAMEEEGFESRDLDASVHDGIEEGLIGKMTVAHAQKQEVLLPIPPFIPVYYMAYVQRVSREEYEELKRNWIESNLFVQEEEYLVGDYPPYTSRQAIDSLSKEICHVRDRVWQEAVRFRQDAIGIWQRYQAIQLPWPLPNSDLAFIGYITGHISINDNWRC